MTRPVTTAFALLFALVLAIPASAQRDRDRDDDRASGPRETETVDRTLPMPAGGTLRLKTFSGRVKITGGSGNQLVVHAIRRATRERLHDIKLEITQSGNTIEVDANHRLVERRNDNVVETDFEIQVPAGTRLDVKTFSAPVTVIGVNASARTSTASARTSPSNPPTSATATISTSTRSAATSACACRRTRAATSTSTASAAASRATCR